MIVNANCEKLGGNICVLQAVAHMFTALFGNVTDHWFIILHFSLRSSVLTLHSAFQYFLHWVYCHHHFHFCLQL